MVTIRELRRLRDLNQAEVDPPLALVRVDRTA